MRIIFLLAIYIFTLFAQENISLQLSWKHQFQFAGYYMAKEKGYYDEAGLNVTIKEYDFGINVTDEVLNEKADFGVGRSSLIHDRLEGKPVVMLGAILQHSPIILLSKQRDDITQVSDLKNKNLMMTNDHVSLASVNAMLLSYGIQSDMYNFQEHSFNIDDLVNDKTDAIVAYVSNEPYALKQKNIPYTVFSPKKHGFDFYSDILFTSEKLIAKDPKRVKSFKDASLKGWKYAMKYPDEAISLILSKYNTQKRTKEALEFEAQSMIQLIDTKNISLGNIEKEKIEKIAQIYRLMGLTTKNKSIENLLYDDTKKYNIPKALHSTFDVDIFMKKIIPLVTRPVYNINTEELPEILGEFLKENTNVKAIKIIEILDAEEGDVVFQFFRNKDKLNFSTKIPESYLDNKIKTNDISFNGEVIGRISTYYTSAKNALELSAKEKKWIEQNPTVIVGEDTDWAPISFIDENGKYSGLSKDYLDLISKKTGLMFEMDKGKTWKQLLKALEDKTIDIIPAIYKNDEREKYAIFTDAYFHMQEYIYTKKNIPTIKDLSTQNGKKIAVVKGYDIGLWVQEKYPKIKIIQYETNLECLQALARNEVDLFIGDIVTTNHMIDSNYLNNISANSLVKDKQLHPLYIALRNDYGLLQSILNKAVKSFTLQDKKNIKDKWIVDQKENTVSYSDKEFQWLQKNKTLSYVYDIDWAPFEWKDDGSKHVGIIKDILDKVSEISRIQFESVDTSSWGDAVQKATNGEVDMYSGVGPNEKKAQYMNFSDPVISYPFIFVSRQGEDYINGFEDTLNKRIAVVKDYAIEGIIKENEPEQKLILVNNITEGLKKLQDNEIDVFVTNQATAAYYIQKNYMFDLRISYKTKYPLDLTIALHKNVAPEAMSIINKSIALINQDTIASIQNKYLVNITTEKDNMALIVKIIAVAILLFLLIIYWNRKLNNLVAMKTKDLNEQTHNQENIIAEQTRDLRKQLKVVKIAERKQEQLLTEIEDEKKFTQALLDSQDQIIITTNDKTMVTANETFYDFFAVDSIEEFMEAYDAKSLGNVFSTESPEGFLQLKMGESGRENWIEYVISRPFDITHKAMISMGSTNFIFSVTASRLPGKEGLMSAVLTDITEMEKAKNEIDFINKHTRESIEYAALIQNALIPDSKLIQKYFQDQFVIWHPKDTVGGDIYLFEELRNEDECLLMVIDCTGHGVPGAFVTMLVKAIERQITSKIMNSDDAVSPAEILSIFNRNMKQLLNQEDEDSVSNAGFDGQIVYYNKKDKIMKTASARNEIFYYQDDELKVIKGDRHSIGYKDSDINFEFTEHTIDVSNETILYISSDGYWDQNGGEKSLPYGKKRLKKMLDKIHNEPMSDQQEEFLYTFTSYKADNETNDDVTVVALKV